MKRKAAAVSDFSAQKTPDIVDVDVVSTYDEVAPLLAPLFLIGVTGAIASGKSAVTAYFKERGVATIDLDELSRQALEVDGTALAVIKETFGADVFNTDGSLNRGALAAIVFTDKTERKKLETIIYPTIDRLLVQELLDECAKARTQYEVTGTKIPIVIEIPLIEKTPELRALCDEVLGVEVSDEVRRERALKRGMSLQDFEQRLKSQLTDEERVVYLSKRIANNGTADELAGKLDAWCEQLASANGVAL